MFMLSFFLNFHLSLILLSPIREVSYWKCLSTGEKLQIFFGLNEGFGSLGSSENEGKSAGEKFNRGVNTSFTKKKSEKRKLSFFDGPSRLVNQTMTLL